MNRENSFYYKGIFITIIAILTAIISCETKPIEPKNDNPFDLINPETGGDPFKLTAKIAGGGITLEWNRPDFKDLRFYRIYRSEQELSGYTQKATFEISQTYYIDKNIENGRSYWYRVTAVSKHDVETKITNTVGVNIKMEPVLVINNGGPYTSAKEVKLTILAASAKQMIISNHSDFSGTNWEKYMTSKNWTLTSGAGQKTVYMKVEYDTSRSIIVHSSIFPQQMEPSISIANGRQYSLTCEVQLTVSAKGKNLQVKLSEDSTFVNVKWQAYITSPNFSLSIGDGQKKLFAQFKNDFEMKTSILSDEIIMDTTPPILVLDVSPDSGITRETSFQFNPMDSNDNLTPAEDLQIRFDYENNGEYDTNWRKSSIHPQIYSIGGGDKNVRVQLKDNAGWHVDTLVNIFVNTRPQASFNVIWDKSNDKLYHFNASASFDYEDEKNIEYRWDFDGDGNWETDWITQDTIKYTYNADDGYKVKLSIRDQNFLANEISENVTVPSSVTDINGNIYRVIIIGDQWWMTDNLKVTNYRNGDMIKHIKNNQEWAGLNVGAYCAYNNDNGNVPAYGLLYNWYAIDDNRIIAPDGWHIPNNSDWKKLVEFLGGPLEAGNKLKEKGTSHWIFTSSDVTNESGFTALPGGSRSYASGAFGGMGDTAYYWSDTEYSSSYSWDLDLLSGSSNAYYGLQYKRCGLNIRCIKD